MLELVRWSVDADEDVMGEEKMIDHRRIIESTRGGAAH